MKQKIKITIIIIFIATSLGVVLLSAYYLLQPPEQQPPEQEAEMGESPPSAIRSPSNTAERYTNKGGTSQNAEAIKEGLVSGLDGGSGTIHEAPEYRVDYIAAPDAFSIEILDPDYNHTKDLAFQWFKQQGFAEEDICEMKILFYLSRGVKTYYDNIGETIEFNPLFDNCNDL